MSSNSVNREPFNEGDASFREFLYALRSQTTSSYLPNSSHSPNLLGPGSTGSLRYKSSAFNRERQPSSGDSGAAAAGSIPRSFVEPGLETGRQAPMFEQPPGASFHRPHDHDMIDLDDPRFGQALGEYSNLCPTAAGTDPPPPFDFHAETMASAAAAAAAAAAASLDQQRQQQRMAGVLRSSSSAGNSDGLLSTAEAIAATAGPSRGLLSLSNSNSQQPINLKAFELIAGSFKEICLDYGNGAAPAGSSSNSISESQRSAQHELLVKLYYEHFKQHAY